MNLMSPACLCFAISTLVAGPVSSQVTARVSLGTGGIQGNQESYYPTLSADGRIVAFYGDASNLVPGDTNGTGDVFVRDRRTSITTRVSVDSAWVQGNGESTYPAISADGRFVAYYSDASNLVPGDTNASEDIFIYDILTRTTTRVSVDSSGAQSNGRSADPSISADGRFVAFDSSATNLVAGDTNGRYDVFVHELVSGITTRVSVNSTGAQGDGESRSASICADGSRVAFGSTATNFTHGGAIGYSHAFVRDLVSATTTCVSVDVNGLPGDGGTPQISGDGHVVAFASGTSTLVIGDTLGLQKIFARDLTTGVTTRVSVDSNGVQGNAISSYLAISFDGRFVVFGSQANNLVPNDTNGVKDIFLRDRRLGTTTRMSVDSNFAQADGWCSTPAISANGLHIAFYSDAANLVHGDTNAVLDVFVRSLK